MDDLGSADPVATVERMVRMRKDKTIDIYYRQNIQGKTLAHAAGLHHRHQ